MKSVKERFQSVEKVGLEKDLFQDYYHRVLTMTWTRFFILYALFFILFNLFFGFLYWFDPSGVTNVDSSFFKDFSFSVQTFSTIGYGIFSPTDNYTHSLVIIESMFSVIFTALLAGLAFSKFARPTARIRFTNKLIITNYNGQPHLMFRLANLRSNQIAEANIRVVALISHKSAEGHIMRLQKDLKLIRSYSAFFILSWTVMHPIDGDSPLFGLSQQDILDQNIDLSVSVIGHDETFSQTVHAACVYNSTDFIFNKKFADLFESVNGQVTKMNYNNFNTIQDV
jgi:inward rectifier potassium channel